MNTADIRHKVSEKADERFGETIQKLMETMKRQHAHKAYMGECYCEYCKFIRSEYTDAKIHLHRLKKRFSYLDDVCNLTELEEERILVLQQNMMRQSVEIMKLKDNKKDLLKQVL